MFLADLHVHSKFSDGSLSIAELVDFYGERGFGCIAITDHVCEIHRLLGLAARCLNLTLTPKSFREYIETIKNEAIRAWEMYRLVLIPGFEITKNALSNHRSAHILGLGISQFIDPHMDVVTIARSIRGQGGIAIAAHPVPTGKAEIQTLHLWSRREELRSEFDAWEVASGSEIFTEVLNSGLPMTASSDLHHPKQIYSWKSVFQCDRSQEAVLEAVRKQQIGFQFYQKSVDLSSPIVIADAVSNSSDRFNEMTLVSDLFS